MSHRARFADDALPPCPADPVLVPLRPCSGWPARTALGLLVFGMLCACDGMSGLSDLEFGQWVGAPCSADTDCDRDTFCAPGIHLCEWQKEIGVACQANNECRNDFCVDGVCCDSACSGVCEVCSAEGSVGSCMAYAAEVDPEDECPGTTTCTGSSSCVGGNLFALAFGDENDQAGVAVAFDSQGNVVLAANFEGIVQVGTETITSQGETDILLAKLTPAGELLWAQAIGGDDDQWLANLVVDADDRIVIAGDYRYRMDIGGQVLTAVGDGWNGEVFVAQLSEAGTPLWIQSINWTDPANPTEGGGSQSARDVAVDQDGNVAICGQFAGGIDIATDSWLWTPGYPDMFLAKLDAQGTFLWSKAFLSDVDAYYLEPEAVAFDASGNLLFGGSFSTGVDLGLGRLEPNGYLDAFLVKYNSDGTSVWTRSYGSGDEEQLRDIAVDSAENILLTGFFTGGMSFGGSELTSEGDRDVFLAKLTPTGDHQWSKQFGGPYAQEGYGVAVGRSDEVLLTGMFTLNVSFELNVDPFVCQGWQDAFLTKLSATGDVVWAQPFGGLLSDQGNGVAADKQSGNAALAGSFQDRISFGGDPFTCAGRSDGFVAVFAP